MPPDVFITKDGVYVQGSLAIGVNIGSFNFGNGLITHPHSHGHSSTGPPNDKLWVEPFEISKTIGVREGCHNSRKCGIVRTCLTYGDGPEPSSGECPGSLGVCRQGEAGDTYVQPTEHSEEVCIDDRDVMIQGYVAEVCLHDRTNTIRIPNIHSGCSRITWPGGIINLEGRVFNYETRQHKPDVSEQTSAEEQYAASAHPTGPSEVRSEAYENSGAADTTRDFDHDNGSEGEGEVLFTPSDSEVDPNEGPQDPDFEAGLAFRTRRW